jgi:hypothetical protein
LPVDFRKRVLFYLGVCIARIGTARRLQERQSLLQPLIQPFNE